MQPNDSILIEVTLDRQKIAIQDFIYSRAADIATMVDHELKRVLAEFDYETEIACMVKRAVERAVEEAVKAKMIPMELRMSEEILNRLNRMEGEEG